MGSLAGAARLLEMNADVLRRAQRRGKRRMEHKGKSSSEHKNCDFCVGETWA